MSDFPQAVSKITPLGDAIDGRRRPVRRRVRSAGQEPAESRSSWICPVCQRETDDPEDQARHVASEVYRMTVALAELNLEAADLVAAIPESPHAREMQVRSLISQDDLRRGRAVHERLRMQGQPIPEEIRILYNEYQRRLMRRQRAKAEAAGVCGG